MSRCVVLAVSLSLLWIVVDAAVPFFTLQQQAAIARVDAVNRGGARSSSSSDDNDRTTQRQQPFWSRLASQSAKLSGKALSATARASGKVAYNLITPKHVDWNELVGLWRLDQWMNDGDRVVQSTIEFTRRQTVLIRNPNLKENPCRFTPAQWPISARLEFEADRLIYTCTIHRKLADKSVLKLRGKIYEKRWGRRVLLGTFIGRRRMKLNIDDEDDEAYDENEDSEEGDDDDREEGYDDEEDDQDFRQDDREEAYDEEEEEDQDLRNNHHVQDQKGQMEENVGDDDENGEDEV